MITYPHFAVTNLYLENGFEREQSSYGEITSYQNEDGLENCVRHILVSIPKRLNGAHLRFLRRGLGLSQEAFGLLIDRDEQTVARMEKSMDPLPKHIDFVIRARYFSRIDPSKSIDEILAIHDGKSRFPNEKIILSHTAGVWSYRFDIPKLIVEITESQSIGLFNDLSADGHIYQRRLIMNTTGSGERSLSSSPYRKVKYEHKK